MKPTRQDVALQSVEFPVARTRKRHMSELAKELGKRRPEFRNIHAFRDLPGYRWPAASIASGMHRISGLLIFLCMPFIIWLFDTSVSSEYSFARFKAAFNVGMGFVPGVIVKLVALALIWAYLHHFICGLRFLLMDVSHKAVNKQFGASSAMFAIVVGLVLTFFLGLKLFGAY
jgi:succinate dehydrogenase / fumarate reductase cytochrome b subunit